MVSTYVYVYCVSRVIGKDISSLQASTPTYKYVHLCTLIILSDHFLVCFVLFGMVQP